MSHLDENLENLSSVPWTIGSSRGHDKTIQQRSSSSLFCRRLLWAVLAWAGMSSLWGRPSSVSSAYLSVAHPPRCPEGGFWRGCHGEWHVAPRQPGKLAAPQSKTYFSTLSSLLLSASGTPPLPAPPSLTPLTSSNAVLRAGWAPAPISQPPPSSPCQTCISVDWVQKVLRIQGTTEEKHRTGIA